MKLIDTHAHIYLPEFDADRDALLQSAAERGVQQIVMPAIDASTHDQMLAVAERFAHCTPMMGLHPCSVKDDFKKELDIVHNHLQQKTFAAVGEIGLDFYWDTTYAQQQYTAFEMQIEWALQYDLPIVIHSRSAMDESIAVVKKYKGLKGVFHCFSGTVLQAQQVTELGFLLGIGGVVTYKNAGLDKVLAEVGIAHIVLETDAPYLSPVPYRGKRNQPAYLDAIAEKVAQVTGKEKSEIAAVTTENARKLFKLS